MQSSNTIYVVRMCWNLKILVLPALFNDEVLNQDHDSIGSDEESESQAVGEYHINQLEDTSGQIHESLSNPETLRILRSPL